MLPKKGNKVRHANIHASDRLQRVLAVLMDRKQHSTRDIVYEANVMAVSACISELRANGIQIECERKKDRWFYALALD